MTTGSFWQPTDGKCTVFYSEVFRYIDPDTLSKNPNYKVFCKMLCMSPATIHGKEFEKVWCPNVMIYFTSGVFT